MSLRGLIKRNFSTTIKSINVIKNVTVIGGGLMGSGIAQITAQTGHNVKLLEINSDVLEKTKIAINNGIEITAKKLYKNQTEIAEKFITDTQARFKGTTDIREAVEDSDLIIEAIVENLQSKQKLFKALDEIAGNKTIFASNTSSLSIKEIASVTKRLDKFAGLHFFSPVPLMKLLEVVQTPETSKTTHETLLTFGKAIGKTCVTCKDTPGFVVNRLLVPYSNEAAKMYDRGDADFKEIDIAMKLGAGYPMGPFELMDFVGIDVGVAIIEGWHQKYPDNPLFEPAKINKKLLSEGKLGRKSGEGFYNYKK